MTTENPYEPPHSDELRPARGCSWITWLAVAGVGGLILLAILLPMSRRDVRQVARRIACSNNLRQIAQAMLMYEQQHGTLPPACTRDAEGRPLHSWRTLILPYLEEKELFDTIDLTKPWDDPANAAAGGRMPSVYRCPGAELPAGRTTYMVVVSPEGCFRPDRSVTLDEVPKPSQTLLVAEFPIDGAVPWMAPEDADEEMFVTMGPGKPPAHGGGVTNIAFADTRVQAVVPGDTTEFDADVRRGLISTAAETPAEIE
jgi:prepilin-type processing-associated H-X9-DG protein